MNAKNVNQFLECGAQFIRTNKILLLYEETTNEAELRSSISHLFNFIDNISDIHK